MGIQKQLWVRDIAENLFPDNSILSFSVDDSQYLDGQTVNLPQSGAVPGVEKNRLVLPAPVVQRVDTVQSYDTNEFTTDPIIIKDVESVEVSYDKRQNVLRDHLEQLNTRMTDEALQIWAPESSSLYVRTSGGTARAAYVSGQTGNRKPMTKADIINAVAKLDAADVPQEGRIMIVDAYLLADMRNISEFMDAEKYGRGNYADGRIANVFGCAVYVRSRVIRYTNDATPAKKAVGAAVAAADNLGALVYHPRFVRRAVGTNTNGGIKVYANEDQAAYYGSIFSAMVRGGFKPRYTDNRGVVAIIEAAA